MYLSPVFNTHGNMVIIVRTSLPLAVYGDVAFTPDYITYDSPIMADKL